MNMPMRPTKWTYIKAKVGSALRFLHCCLWRRWESVNCQGYPASRCPGCDQYRMVINKAIVKHKEVEIDDVAQ